MIKRKMVLKVVPELLRAHCSLNNYYNKDKSTDYSTMIDYMTSFEYAEAEHVLQAAQNIIANTRASDDLTLCSVATGIVNTSCRLIFVEEVLK